MAQMLQRCLDDKNITHVDIATGFWDLRGTKLIFEQIKAFLNREGSKLRLLLGKDPYLYRGDIASLEEKPYKKQEDGLLVEMNDFEANPEYVEIVQLLVDSLNDENKKFEIKVYKPDGELKDQFLHSKCYIFYGKDEDRRNVAYGIIGSSNLTKQGFEGNSELNVLEDNPNDIITINTESRDKTHLQWFNEKWELGQDWNQEFLLQVQSSKIAPKIINIQPAEEDVDSPLTPYELYIKLLQTRFGDIVDIDTSKKIESYLPARYTVLQYQTDAVTQCYNIMQKHGGFMLADVVGLGKTVVGTMLIKHFLSIPDKDSREHKVLIVTPPAIKKGWEETIADFDKDRKDDIASHVTFITTGSISHLVDDDEEDTLDNGEFNEDLDQVNYGLILIDESHKFRNSETSMYRLLDKLIENISNVAPQPYVGLLSATPQNNTPNDLRNQLYLFERSHNACSLEGDACNLEHFFTDISQRYKCVLRGSVKDSISGEEVLLTPEECKSEMMAISTEIRTKVLDQILVRRTRTDVKKYKENKLVFPEVAAPIALEYQLNQELSVLFKDTMECIAPDVEEGMPLPPKALGYYRYRSIQYLSIEDNKNRYSGKGSLGADRIANQLANIMQILLVKRLESSKDAFTKSLSNLLQYTNNMIKMWENRTIFICPEFDVNQEFENQNDWDVIAANIRSKIEKLNKEGRNNKQSNAEYSIDDFNPDFIKLLRRDRDILQSIVTRWNAAKSDPKKLRFRKELRRILPETDPTKKLVIFTESADTLESIAEVVEEEIGKPLCITAKNRKDCQQSIQENFDANYGKKDGESQKNDYQVIISTDVLAEGVNLHRAYTIINYDTPWNSTKLMQRIGRVNRIGSESDFVYIYNFMPCDEGNKKIKLFERAFTKLQSFHTLFGEDAQVYSTDEEVTHYEQDFSKFVDGEESPMMKYLFELREYKKAHPLRYDAIDKKETELEVATCADQKESLFVIRNNKTAGMYVATDADGKRSMVSLEDMLKRFNSGMSALSVTLPEGTGDIKRKAIRTFTREFDHMQLQRSKEKQNNARNIIVSITTKYPKLSIKAIDLLSQARELVDKGNVDICKCINSIGDYLKVNEPELFPLSIPQIEEFIQNQLQHLDQRLQEEVGKGEVYMALYKI